MNYKNKKVFQVLKKPQPKKEKLVRPFNKEKGSDMYGYEEERNELFALIESKNKPPPKLTDEKLIFGK
jgi:hypothetical protein